MLGVCTTLTRPMAPMTTNQRNITGPKATLTRWVPNRCARKSATNTQTSAIGTTAEANSGSHQFQALDGTGARRSPA